MKICGLDLSLTATGFCELGGLDRIETIKPAASGEFERLAEIRSKVVERAAGSDLVVMEALAMNSRTGKALERAGLWYIVAFSLRHKGIPFIRVAPQSVKKFVMGSGKGEKELLIREVYRRWNILAADNNQADAYGMARIGLCLMGQAEPETNPQREVIETVSVQMAAIRKAA